MGVVIREKMFSRRFQFVSTSSFILHLPPKMFLINPLIPSKTPFYLRKSLNPKSKPIFPLETLILHIQIPETLAFIHFPFVHINSKNIALSQKSI